MSGASAAAVETVLEHPITGMKIEIVRSGASTGGELVEMVATYPPRSPRPPLHFHPHQEERFEVLAGAMQAIVAGERRSLAAGDRLVLPARTPHTMWNASEVPAGLRWESRPALATERFFADLFALAVRPGAKPDGRPALLDLAWFVPRYWAEFRSVSPPAAVQRLLFAALAPVARLSGHSGRSG